jgi:hypothetical protein
MENSGRTPRFRKETAMADKSQHPGPTDRQLQVWLSPGAHGSVSDLADQLRDVVRLIVVPKTGSRRADIAILSDPEPGELEGVARVLPGTPLLATTTAPPTSALADAARRVGARLLTGVTAPALLREIRVMCAG